MSETFRERRQRREAEEAARLLADPKAAEAYENLKRAFTDFGLFVRPAVEAAPEADYRRAFARSMALTLMRDAEELAWRQIAPEGVS